MSATACGSIGNAEFVAQMRKLLRGDRKGRACPEGTRASLTTAPLLCKEPRCNTSDSAHEKVALIVQMLSLFRRWAEYWFLLSFK
jgi:hypothetical protein